jgi:hypothetical protein
VHSFLKQLMALPFLPAEHITDTFLRLETRNNNQAVQHVLDYIYRTWIRNPVFPIQFWSVYKTSVCTNNHVEGWHNRINNITSARGKVPFYCLIAELYQETTAIPLQLKLVSEGKLKCHQRKSSRQTLVDFSLCGTTIATTSSVHPDF